MLITKKFILTRVTNSANRYQKIDMWLFLKYVTTKKNEKSMKFKWIKILTCWNAFNFIQLSKRDKQYFGKNNLWNFFNVEFGAITFCLNYQDTNSTKMDPRAGGDVENDNDDGLPKPINRDSMVRYIDWLFT